MHTVKGGGGVKTMCKKLRELNEMNVPGNYQKTAANLFAKTGWNTIPIDIAVILERLEIPYESRSFSNSEKKLANNKIAKGIQGMVHVEEDNIKIYYNPQYKKQKTPTEKLRFTLAHELAHCILHFDEINSKNGYLDYYRLELDITEKEEEEEIEANTLAGEILMPSSVFKTIYKILKEDFSYTETVGLLSKIFEVSKSVVTAKIKYLNL